MVSRRILSALTLGALILRSGIALGADSASLPSFADLVSRWSEQNDKIPFIRIEGHTVNYAWDAGSSSWKVAPPTDTFRLIFENKPPGRYVLDLDPSINIWTNGAAPYGASWITEYRDADQIVTRWIKAFQHYDGNRLLGSRMEDSHISKQKQRENESGYAETTLSGFSYTPLGALRSFDRRPIDEIEADKRFAVSRQDDGMLRVDCAWPDLGQRFELVVDPAKNYALVRFVNAHDWKEGSSHDFVNTYEVLEHRKLPNDIWYPARFAWTQKYSDTYARHLLDKNKNNHAESFQPKKRQVIFDQLEVLPATSDPAKLFSVALPPEKTANNEPGLFEMRAVTKAPTETAKPYSLARREGQAETILVEPAVLLDQSALQSASLETDSDGAPQIRLSLTKDGAKKFGEITGQNIDKRLAIFADHQLRSAPVIRNQINGGSAIISGNFTQAEASALVDRLNKVAPGHPSPNEGDSSSASAASDLSFHGPAWNDLSIPLGIQSFYLEINSKLTAHKISIDVEIYKEGKRIYSIPSVGMGSLKDPHPVDLKCALYFTPEGQNYNGKIVLQWDKNTGVASFVVARSDLMFEKGLSPASFGAHLVDLPRAPVFQIVTGTNHFSVGGDDGKTTPESLIAANPDAIVIIGYLNRQ